MLTVACCLKCKSIQYTMIRILVTSQTLLHVFETVIYLLSLNQKLTYFNENNFLSSCCNSLTSHIILHKPL